MQMLYYVLPTASRTEQYRQFISIALSYTSLYRIIPTAVYFAGFINCGV